MVGHISSATTILDMTSLSLLHQGRACNAHSFCQYLHTKLEEFPGADFHTPQHCLGLDIVIAHLGFANV